MSGTFITSTIANKSISLGAILNAKKLYNFQVPEHLEQFVAEVHAEQLSAQFEHFPTKGYIADGHCN